MVLPTFLKTVKKEYLAAAIFASLIILFYGNTLFNGFVQDDVSQIEKNVYIKSLDNIHRTVTGCTWEYVNKGCKGRTFYYRPIQYLAYFLTYQISSAAWIFHLMNLFYFFIAVFLVFTLARIITANFALAFLSGLVFLIHPVNNEVINWVSAASEILFVNFVLLAVIYYIKYRDTGLVRNLVLVYIFYFLALLSKETAVLLPMIIVSVDLLFFETTIKELVRQKEFKRYSIFAVPFLIYFLMRNAVIGSSSYLGQFTLSERFYTFFVLFGQYLKKLFYPYPLQAIYDFSIKPNFSSPYFLISSMWVLAFFILLIMFIKKQKNLFVFSLIWLFLFLIPPLIFLEAAGAGVSFLFERYLFASAVGFSLALSYFIFYIVKVDFLIKKSFNKIILSILFVSLIIGAWYFNYQRNKIWKSNEIFYTVTLSQVPNAHNIRYQLGDIYLKKGDLDNARIQFEEIIKRNPNWKDITMAYKGLGDYYRVKGDLDGALEAYKRSVETAAPSPRDYISFNDLGMVYVDKGNYLKGIIYFCQSLILLPQTEVVMNNFNEAVMLIESNYSKKNILYAKILEEFKEATAQKIQYLGKKCSEKNCQYEFSFNNSQLDILLPFLISASTSLAEDEIKIKDPFFDQQQGIMGFKIDKNFSKKDIVFVFPSCGGVYYKVEVKSDQQ